MKQKFIFALSLTLCFLLCLRAEVSASAAKEALFLCAETVIPNLFPFFVLSSFLVQVGLTSAIGALLAPAANKLFGISGSGASVFIIGMLCGYPTGAKTIAELYEKRLLSKQEAEHLLPFCNNAGPLFCIGAVGGMLGNAHTGQFLYILHLVSAILTGVLLTSVYQKEPASPSPPVQSVHFGTAISVSMQSAVGSVLSVCGYVVFFSVLRSLLPPGIGTLLSVPLEVTAATSVIHTAPISFPLKLVLLSASIAFGGFCVLMQVWGFVASTGLSVKNYIRGKLLQTILASGLTAVFLLPVSRLLRFSVFLLLTAFLFLLIRLTKSVSDSIIRKECKTKESYHEPIPIHRR